MICEWLTWDCMCSYPNDPITCPLSYCRLEAGEFDRDEDRDDCIEVEQTRG